MDNILAKAGRLYEEMLRKNEIVDSMTKEYEQKISEVDSKEKELDSKEQELVTREKAVSHIESVIIVEDNVNAIRESNAKELMKIKSERSKYEDYVREQNEILESKKSAVESEKTKYDKLHEELRNSIKALNKEKETYKLKIAENIVKGVK